MLHVCLLPGPGLLYPVGAAVQGDSVSPHSENKNMLPSGLYSVLTSECSYLAL